MGKKLILQKTTTTTRLFVEDVIAEQQIETLVVLEARVRGGVHDVVRERHPARRLVGVPDAYIYIAGYVPPANIN